MKNQILSAAALAGLILSFSSCKKEDNPSSIIKAYTVPTTYNFANAKYTQSTQLVKMAVEIDAYLKKPNTGSVSSPIVVIDKAVISNMFINSGNPFTDAALNSAGINITAFTADASLFKSYADSVVNYNNGIVATPGNGGFVSRSGTSRIVVGPRGLEYGQAFTKGVMGAMLYKEVVAILTSVKSLDAKDTINAQSKWDAAFGLLSVPVDYDTAKAYVNTDPNRPLLWGGYLAERGKAIQAGGTIFNAFLKGRAAIGGYDKVVRDQQADIILAKWEQLAAAAALNYVTSPATTAAAANPGSQLHGLSEGFGFFAALKYRPASSKLSAADYAKLQAIINTDFYVLLGQKDFTDLVSAQNILKKAYAL